MAKYFTFNPETIQYGFYANGRIAITLMDPIEGPLCKATINISDYPVRKDEVLIKNYSENEGILEDLVAHKIISEPISLVRQGNTLIHVCKLLHHGIF